jgi:hypothetical protein
MYFADGLIVDRTWQTSDGFLGFSARFARTGIQMYRGDEIDPDGMHKDSSGGRRFQADKLYPVDRPAEEVFAQRALGSFLAKPITNDHPSNGVTIDNWSALAKGAIGEVVRDGEYARMSGLITDKATISDYQAGKRELSGGYGAEIVVADGVNAKGEPFVAKQTTIDGNHVALVDRGRAGSECSIRDALPRCATAPQSFLDHFLKQEIPAVKTMLIDGLTVDIANADTAMATIQTILAARDEARAKVAGLQTEVATLTTDKATLDAQVVTLNQQLVDSKPTPAQLRDAARNYALTAGKAKALGVAVTDAMDEPAIMSATVTAKMGDAAKGWNADQIAASFAVLTKDAKIEATDALRDAITNLPINMGDAQTEYAAAQEKRKRALGDAWKNPFNAADAAAH